MKNNIEELIKRHLEAKMTNEKDTSSKGCPTELELSDFAQGRLSGEKQHLLIGHVADCSHCLYLLKLVEEAGEEAQAGPDAPSPEALSRARNVMPAGPKRPILSYKWTILAIISFALSFMVKKYFLQFLTLTIIFSLKWIFAAVSTRTLIMVYQAWRKKDKGTAQRIIRDFQDRIQERR